MEDVLHKLLNLAERPGTRSEGESAMRRAEEIARVRGIDLAAFLQHRRAFQTQPVPAVATPPKASNPPKNPIQRFHWWMDRQPEPKRMTYFLCYVAVGIFPLSSLSVVHDPKTLVILLGIGLLWLSLTMSKVKYHSR